AGLDATRNPAELEVLVAPGASGRFVLGEDREDDVVDGAGGADGAGPAARTVIGWDREQGELRIAPVEGDAGVLPAQRAWTLTFLAALPAGPVTVDGAEVQVSGADG